MASSAPILIYSAPHLGTLQRHIWRRLRLFARGLPRRGAHRPKNHRNSNCLSRFPPSDDTFNGRPDLLNIQLNPSWYPAFISMFLDFKLLTPVTTPTARLHLLFEILPAFFGLGPSIERHLATNSAAESSKNLGPSRLSLHIGASANPSCNCVPREELLMSESGTSTKVGVLHFDDPGLTSQESYRELNSEVTSQLLATYSKKLTSLEIVCSQVGSATIDPHLVDLLGRWGPQLISLQLWFDHLPGHAGHVSATFQKLFSCITAEKMPTLRRLTFHYQGPVCADQSSLDLPILCQLEEFTFQGGHGAQLLDSLIRYALPNTRLRKIALGSRISGMQSLEAFLNLPAHLAAKFTYLEVHQKDADCRQLTEFFSHFHCLNTLSLNASLMPISALSTILEPLTRLTYLRLSLNIRQLLLEQLESITFISQIQSIKVLELTFTGCQSSDSLARLCLHRLFPHVQLLRFVLNGRRRRGSTEAELVSPFVKHCADLRLVCASLNSGREKVWENERTATMFC